MTPTRLAAALCLLLATTPHAHAVQAERADAAANAEAGATLYRKYCLTCHGVRLEGYGGDNAPSLASPTFRATATDAFLRAAITQGRPGTAMAGYSRTVGGPLTAAEIDTLIAFIRGGTTPGPLARMRAKGSVADGARVYAAHCQTCHGTADQRATAVHLANPMFLATASDAFLRAAVEHGRPGTPMESWSGKLSAREIDDVVAYVRSLARPVPPAPVPVAAAAGDPAVPSVENVPVVLNPAGEQASLALRDGRFASVADVAKAYGEKRRLVLVDARTTSDYFRMHITGAISIPYFNMHDLDKIPNDGTWVITYCACPHHVSVIVLEELRKRGYQHSAVLDEGILVWQQQGHPVTAAPGQLPIAAPPNGVPLMPNRLP